MKEILSVQLDTVSGGWHDQDGSGHHSVTNNGSRSGSSNNGGNGGNYIYVNKDLLSIGSLKRIKGGYFNNFIASHSYSKVVRVILRVMKKNINS